MREIDDGKTPHRHGDGALAERADAVGTAIAHDIAQRVEQGVRKIRLLRIDEPDDAAHIILVRACAFPFATRTAFAPARTPLPQALRAQPARVPHRAPRPAAAVVLHERNGGGMRTLLAYLSQLGAREFHSVHFGDTTESGVHGLGRVGYLRVDKLPFPQSLTSYARILRKLRREIGEDASFLLLPNTKDDVQLCLAATFVSARTRVWVMDDFVTTLFPN